MMSPFLLPEWPHKETVTHLKLQTMKSANFSYPNTEKGTPLGEEHREVVLFRIRHAPNVHQTLTENESHRKESVIVR